MKTLGKKIRLLRHQKGWSQEDVAKRLDISIPAFSKIETGITDINLSRLEQISNLFEMTVVQLLTFNESEQKKVEAFIAAGGNLFVSGTDIGWDLDHEGHGRPRGHPSTRSRTVSKPRCRRSRI